MDDDEPLGSRQWPYDPDEPRRYVYLSNDRRSVWVTGAMMLTPQLARQCACALLAAAAALEQR